MPSIRVICSSPLTSGSAGGMVFNRAIKRLGIKREDFHFMGPNDSPPPSSIKTLSLSYPMSMRGFLLPNIPAPGIVLFSYDPAILIKGQMHLFGALLHDIRKLANAPSVIPPDPDIFKTIDSPSEELEVLAAAAHAPLISYDIETSRKINPSEDEDAGKDGDIVSFQFSLDGVTGYFLPWFGRSLDFVKALMAIPTPKVGHNSWQFDAPILTNAGITINGPQDDTRWMWHHLQPELPGGLEYISSFYDVNEPWKSLAQSEPVKYGAKDASVTWRLRQGIAASLSKQGLLGTYERHVRQLQKVLGDMSKRGLPVDPKLYAALVADVEEQRSVITQKISGLIPDELRPFHPPDGYKTEANFKRAVARGGEFKLHKFGEEERWVCLDEWKPSVKGLTAYAQAKGHTIPKKFRSKEASFAHIEIERLFRKTKDPLYGSIIQGRRLGTFGDNHLPNWKPGEDGRVHSQFSFQPATGQLSSRRPNVQNAPKYGDALANQFRGMIAAPLGFTLLEFDYKSFHALTLGFEAQDESYMRLARLDIHSYLASHLVKEPIDPTLPDGELQKRLADIKRRYRVVRDTRAKPSILGFGFGLGYRKFYHMNQDNLDNQAEAKYIIEMLRGLFPKVVQFQMATRQLAHKQGFLKSRAGYIRYFWDVMHMEHGEWKAGADSEAAIAFLPANDAFGHIKDAMLRLETAGWCSRAHLINQVHDSLLFLCPLALRDEAIVAIREEMSKPSAVLEGLAPQVSVSYGPAWNQMEEII